MTFRRSGVAHVVPLLFQTQQIDQAGDCGVILLIFSGAELSKDNQPSATTRYVIRSFVFSG